MRSSRHLDCWILPWVFLSWVCQLDDLIQYSKLVIQGDRLGLNMLCIWEVDFFFTLVKPLFALCYKLLWLWLQTCLCSLKIVVWGDADLMNFQIQMHYVFSYNTCKITFYYMIKFEAKIFYDRKNFWFSCFFSPLLSHFLKQIVTDFHPCVRHSLGEGNSETMKTHNLPPKPLCLEESETWHMKGTVKGVSHVLQRRREQVILADPMELQFP